MNQIISFAVLNREFDGACVHIKHFCTDAVARGAADGVTIEGCGGRVLLRDERCMSRDRAATTVAVFVREMLGNGFVVSGSLNGALAEGAAIH